MSKTAPSIAKITPPKIAGEVRRERLFGLLDSASESKIIWITAPAGSGKSTLVASWLAAREFRSLWLQLDGGDADPASFFYYLGLAAEKAAPRKKKPLPLLTPEYLMNMPTFSRRYFEELFNRLSSLNRLNSSNRSNRFILVLDNYQEVSADSVLHELLLHGFESLPEGASAVVISRGEPASQFARLRANGRMAIVGWNELRFTLDEVKDAVKPWRRKHCLERDCPGPDLLFEKTDGWAAGLRLMIEAVEPQRNIVRNTPPDEPVCHCVESLAWKDNVFSYFACEVMNRTDHSICDFLAATSFLPFMTPGIAEKLTGRRDAGAILRDLSRRNFFTEWHPGPVPVYQYHFLFREFLQDRARGRYSDEERRRIRRAGAELLEEAGFLMQAADLYSGIGAYDRAAPLISRAAWPLLAQGRLGTVEGLLAKLPQEIFEADAGLLHIAGLDRMTSNLAESRTLLEKAFRRYLGAENYIAAIQVGGSSLEALIIEGSSYEAVDHWVDALDTIVKKHRASLAGAEAQAAGIVLFALAYRNLTHPSLPFWLETAEASVLKLRDAAQVLKLCNYLMAYYLFSGEYGSMGRLMKVLTPFKKNALAAPALHLLCLLLESFYAVYALGEVEEGIGLARKGLVLGRETGVSIYGFWFSYLIVASSVAAGDLPAAEECLLSLRAGAQGGPPVRRGDLLTLSGAVAMGRQAWSEAAGYFEQAADIVRQAGATYSAAFYRVLLSHALFELGEEKKARTELAAAAREKWAHSDRIRFHGLLTEAYFDLRLGNREQARAALREGFKAAKTGCILTAPFWNPDHTSLVCAEALDASIEREFVRQIIKKHSLPPPAGVMPVTDAWPWPVRIYTLGGFRIFREDVLLEFSGKAPQKPLELLKALIAFGGRSVPEEKLTDVLWPDADGDLAHQSFESTLSRLRKLFGGDDCIRYGGRLLSLDPRRCWVDSIAFEAISKEGADMPDREILRIYGESAGLYKGPFLPGDAGREWAVSRSEALRHGMLRICAAAGKRYEQDGLWESAIDCYRKGLNTDSLAEEFYRSLMSCYEKLGRRNEAVQLYNRCADLFQKKLGIAPSPETEALYSSLVKKK